MSNFIELDTTRDEVVSKCGKRLINLDYVVQIWRDEYEQTDFKHTTIYLLYLELQYTSSFRLCFKTKKERDYYYDCIVNAMTKNNIIKV